MNPITLSDCHDSYSTKHTMAHHQARHLCNSRDMSNALSLSRHELVNYSSKTQWRAARQAKNSKKPANPYAMRVTEVFCQLVVKLVV